MVVLVQHIETKTEEVVETSRAVVATEEIEVVSVDHPDVTEACAGRDHRGRSSNRRRGGGSGGRGGGGEGEGGGRSSLGAFAFYVAQSTR